MNNVIEMLFELCNIQVFDMIDGKPVSPFMHLNLDLFGQFPDSSGGEDYTVDVDAGSLEMVVLEAAPLAVQEAFHHSMVPVVMETSMMATSGESS